MNFCKKNQLKDSMGNNKNNEVELIDLVFSLYDYRINRENLINPKLFKNIRVKGKNIEHKIDIYIEFVQMNNLEKTVIKIIDNKIVKAEDVWQFDNLLKDLGYFPKGVLYYNDKIDEEALKLAKDKHIQTIYFDMMNEMRTNVLQSIGKVLPDENDIGDPFWTLMQIDERTKNNTGNYFITGNSLLLFTSKKFAEVYCKQQNGYAVFGISQYHLVILISLAEHRLLPKLSLIWPSKQNSSIIDYNINKYIVDYNLIREVYVR